jgi:uracil-DNA glycosylase family 4
MMVGEQPGFDEDLAGPAFCRAHRSGCGRVLDKAIQEADLDRRRVFVTNAVKHFKFEPPGKRGLHKRPNAYEIERCRWWLDQERTIVKPAIIVALGATAARSLFGRTVTIAKVRGEIVAAEAGRILVTIHPSYLLRIKDEHDKAEAYRGSSRICGCASARSPREAKTVAPRHRRKGPATPACVGRAPFRHSRRPVRPRRKNHRQAARHAGPVQALLLARPAADRAAIPISAGPHHPCSLSPRWGVTATPQWPPRL